MNVWRVSFNEMSYNFCLGTYYKNKSLLQKEKTFYRKFLTILEIY